MESKKSEYIWISYEGFFVDKSAQTAMFTLAIGSSMRLKGGGIACVTQHACTYIGFTITPLCSIYG